MSLNEPMASKKIAVVIPCYNEEITIAKVVNDFRIYLPEADIYVFDNNSSDQSVQEALKVGAKVIREKRQGKGFVVMSMLEHIDADYQVMVDGDDTYPADQVMTLLEPIINGDADMVVGQRLSSHDQHAFRPFHMIGNRLVAKLINLIFGTNLKDPMSGYRAYTNLVAKNLPVVASGFDVETEMTLQLLYRHYIICEVPVTYRSRPAGSESKLRTIRDGIKVLFNIFSIVRAYKPLTFFGSMGLVCLFVSFITGGIVINEYILFQYIYRVPTAILAGCSFVLGVLLISIGTILNSLNYRILEMTNVISKQIQDIKKNIDRV